MTSIPLKKKLQRRYVYVQTGFWVRHYGKVCAVILIIILVNIILRNDVPETFSFITEERIHDLMTEDGTKTTNNDNLYLRRSVTPFSVSGSHRIPPTQVELSDYAYDNEDFLELVPKTYDDEDLFEWQPPLPIQSDPKAPGYNGSAVVIPPERLEESKQRFELHQFNIVASEMMSINRSYPDMRDPKCKLIEYPRKLPQASVIITFYNEEWSVLIRTVWSIFARSPQALLKEIILVDDGSDHKELGQKLEDYIKQLPVKVVLLRTGKRAGIVNARLLGIKNAEGPVIAFLDAHVECNDGWLEPLLAAVAEDRTVLATPVGDFITYDTFSVYADERSMYGIINWGFTFNWINIPERELKRTNYSKTAIIRTPAFVGGLFAMDKEYFYKSGSYDEKMKVWGGEEIEMSMRIWSCGGQILMPLCSRVGHMARRKRFYTDSLPGGIYPLLMANMMRYIDVWADEYAEYFYAQNADVRIFKTDITNRKKLRRDLKCKSFRWYLKNVDPESTMNVDKTHLGEIENVGKAKFCLHENTLKASISMCNHIGTQQLMIITKKNEIRRNFYCVDAIQLDQPVIFHVCHGGINQRLVYNERTQEFRLSSIADACISADNDLKVYVRKCDGSPLQQWILSKLPKEM